MAEPQRPETPFADAAGARVLIIEAPFYDAISKMLLHGARRVLDAAGASVDIESVPGALEVPIALGMAIDRGGYDAVVALGCVIRGETYHFELVANESARGMMDLAVAARLPLGNGILTVEDEAQAIVRADPSRGDKGGDAARAALALLRIKRKAQA
jgi:6,7-dimethyl-8-ribityllumazine synthase